jgi:hypothetical protein
MIGQRAQGVGCAGKTMDEKNCGVRFAGFVNWVNLRVVVVHLRNL